MESRKLLNKATVEIRMGGASKLLHARRHRGFPRPFVFMGQEYWWLREIVRWEKSEQVT